MVRTHNYAGVPDKILADAEHRAADIFRRAGIEPAWIECPRSPTELETFRACTQMTHDPRALALHIITESMTAGFNLAPTSYGVTLQGHASYVFFERVQGLAVRYGFSEPAVLGPVIAHELGHLLLGEKAHSDQGLMMANLHIADFRGAEKGILLNFSREQSQRMRIRLQERITRAGADRSFGTQTQH